MYDVLVLGGTAVTPTATEALDLAVEGERIVAIDRPGALGAEARKVIDASGCLVLPGGIDPHVHYAVDFQGLFVTEGQEHSAASALGGTTTICDFMIQEPGTSLHDAIAAKRAQSDGSMAIHGAYICETRGPLVEEAAIRRAMLLAERAGSPLYVLHMAAGAGIEALAEGRAKGLPFYGETLLAYLCFTQEELWDESPIEVNGKTYNARGMLYNSYPTPKFPPDREVCWQAIADNRLQAVGPDHCLISLPDRFEVLGTELPFPQAGQAAVELRPPVLYSKGVQEGRLSLERFVGSRSGGRLVPRTLLPEVLARPLDPSLTLEPARAVA